MSNVYIVGRLSVDIKIDVNRFPTKNEVVMGTNAGFSAASKAEVEAITLSKLSTGAKLLGAVGSDVYGREIVNTLKKYPSIDLTHIKEIEGEASGICFVLSNNKSYEKVRTLGANTKITEENVHDFLESAKEKDILLTDLELGPVLTKYTLKEARDKKMTIIFNPSPVDKNAIDLLNFADYLILDEDDFNNLRSQVELEYFTKELKSLNTIVTLGSAGVYCPDEDVRFSAFFADQAVDTRRADAIFIGAFISMIKDGHKMIEAIDFARGAASLSCTRRGTYESIPERAEVLKLIKREDLL